MSLRAVVAIPAQDEAERIGPCLAALDGQCDEAGAPLARGSFGVVLFVNNSHNATAALARDRASQLAFPLRVVEQNAASGQAHAGWARRCAMDLAADWLHAQAGHDGVLLTTDADSRVAPTWLSRNLAAIDKGADGVAGCILLDPDDAARLPEAVHRRGRLEHRYETLLTELRAHLDPQPHDPWPHHATASGASLAVTVEAYRRIGGLPALPLGEDKALVAALLAHDARVRHEPGVEVVTSGRLDGRAVGGVADTLRLRSAQPDALCDEALEPVGIAIRRSIWRHRLRHLHGSRRLGEIGTWAARLGVHPLKALSIGEARYFGMAWRLIEQASNRLQRRRLRPSELPTQIACASRALGLLRGSRPRDDVPADRADIPGLAPA